jgi:hypothetical protein
MCVNSSPVLEKSVEVAFWRLQNHSPYKKPLHEKRIDTVRKPSILMLQMSLM